MKPSFPTIKELDDLAGQRVFLRGALNVPVADGVIVDDYRLQKLIPTISWLQGAGAKIILAGHMSNNESNSLKPLVEYFQEKFELKVTFVPEYDSGQASEVINSMEESEVVLLENLRQYSGEGKNSESFVWQLSQYADIYINDAFPASHREHASIVGVPKLLPSFAGLQFAKEYETLSTALDPEHPFVFILGGAKFSTKLPLAEKFAGVADYVFAGGALANAYLAASGKSVGASVVPEEEFDLSGGLASEALKLPTDVVVLTSTGDTSVKSVEDVSAEETIVDLGPETLKQMTEVVQQAKLVVWNGPLGWYEKGFSEGTDKLAEELSKIEGETLIGGGDTVAVILRDLDPGDFSFVSTAGGAMITFLSSETLPGINALQS